MSAIRFTKDQQKVIDTHNRNILVSAAAGSGKTAVLVERIIQMIMDETNDVTIDRLLVVTFTNAAASEMRERIGEALYKAIELHPESDHLRTQLTLLPSASIMTLHAFCLQVIRNYFYEIDLDPSFRIGDETELVLLRQEVLEEVLEDFYSEGTDSFKAFVDAYGRGKTDHAIEGLILDLYTMSMSHPQPEQWLQDCLEHLNIATEDEWYDSIYAKAMSQEIYGIVTTLRDYLTKGFDLITEDPGLEPMGITLTGYREILEHLESIEDTPELFSEISAVELQRAKSAKRGTDKSLVEPVRDVITTVKDGIKGLKDQFGITVNEAFIDRLQISHGHMTTLVEVINGFRDSYNGSKRMRNLIDFNDIEHFALEILTDETIADRYRQQFDEIMVDEYQDSNLVQETLVEGVSRVAEGKPNIFMVGDMKQSIYKFRLAKPELFAHKYDTYTLEESPYQKIELHQNFRSRAQVLDFTNYVFRQVMSREIGDVTYDDHAALYRGAKYNIETSQYGTRLVMMDSSGYGGLTNQEIEAEQVAKEIEQILTMEPPLMVYDKAMGTERKVMYKDIAVLLRTMSGWSETFVDILGDHSIPVKSHTATGYFDAVEIQTILSALTIIDNPKQDIPLLAVMRSPMFGFTGDELVTIRMTARDMDFHSALMAFYNSILGESEIELKVSAFVETLERWRRLEKEVTLYELTQAILTETAYYDYVSLMVGGPQRQANLDMFLDQVYKYEKSSYRGLFDFIRYMAHIKKQSIDYGMAELLETSTNQVTVMSIHKSKGLEFPVVIVAGLNKSFNRMDLNRAVLMHQDMGFGTDTIIPDDRIKYPSPIRKVLRNKMDIEMKSEELRILYVALTRAREKLILVGTVKDSDKYLSKWCKALGESGTSINQYMVRDGSSYLDYLTMALVRHKEMAQHYNHLGFDYTAPIELSDMAPEVEVAVFGVASDDEALLESTGVEAMEGQASFGLDDAEYQINAGGGDTENGEEIDLNEKVYDLSKLTWVYEHEASTKKHVSQSVSDLKKAVLEDLPYIGPVLEEVSYKPLFVTGERPLTGAQKGTAFHKAMDKLDLTQTYAIEDLKRFLASLVALKILTEKEVASIYPGSIDSFMKSDLGNRARKAALEGRLHQEKPFVMGVEEEGIEGYMMIQGVIDLYFEEEGDLVLVDYKTDYMKDVDESVLVERYASQMGYYKQALEQSTGKRVKEIQLYSVGLKRAVEVVV